MLTPTGVGTLAAEGKQTIEIEGRTCLVEPPLKADVALLRASVADYCGNLVYRLTAENFNPIMAMAADLVIVEPGEIVPVGSIAPDEVETPGVLVDYLIAREAA